MEYVGRRRRLSSPGSTRSVTCTGWRAFTTRRLRCGTLLRSPLSFLPAPLRAPPQVVNSNDLCAARFIHFIDERRARRLHFEADFLHVSELRLVREARASRAS